MIEYTTKYEDRLWIAHDGADVVHYGEETVGTHVVTGQPYLETFSTREAWLARLAELGVTEVE